VNKENITYSGCVVSGFHCDCNLFALLLVNFRTELHTGWWLCYSVTTYTFLKISSCFHKSYTPTFYSVAVRGPVPMGWGVGIKRLGHKLATHHRQMPMKRMSGAIPPPHRLPSSYAQGQLPVPFVNWIDSCLNMDRFLKNSRCKSVNGRCISRDGGGTCQYSWPS